MKISVWVRSALKPRIWLPVASLLAFVVMCNQLALKYPLRFDLTEAGLYSISPETKAILAELREPVRITYFYDVRHRSMLDGKALLEQYASHSRQISVRAVDPIMEPSVARRYNVMFPGTTVFEAGERRVTIQGGSETDFTNGLIRVSQRARQRICFTEGHGEADPYSLKAQDHAEQVAGPGAGGRDDGFGRALEIHEKHGMAMTRDALDTLGYDVRKVLLLQAGGDLSRCAAIVVAGPARPFLETEQARLADYLEGGGKVLALVEAKPHGLGKLFARYGIVHEAVEVSDPDRHYGTDDTSPAVDDYPRHAITRNLPLTFFPGASALSPVERMPTDVRILPFLQTTTKAHAQAVRMPGMQQAQQAEKSPPGKLTLGVLSTRTLPGRNRVDADGDSVPVKAELAVISDADFAANAYFGILGNGILVLNLVNYLAEQEQLVTIRPRNYELPQVKLTNGQMRFTFLLSTVVLPLLAALAAILVWWRRRG